ncbi:hypothetical protein PISMIDRAFT_25487 [Pisolithus microcarpus 441]|uniref:Uncharacterized protein n=1 Tax=Pisolithus microcarpus 441 TaxID=765257 RepID=A0A0C9YTV6_9AGAM|nr:hypothetical protein BKA83DRAFT_25487 [Pisolithus microcarpus]KIK13732.1 hypothetical protein PISMIDRAFT_25487 [Pisolithus microcarpus 441]
MRRSFGIEFSLPAIAVPSEYVRAALPMDCWIMFTPTTSFNKVGKLVFRCLNSGEFPDKSFDHWAMATPDNNPGHFIAYDIIAYGNTLIPEEVEEMEMAYNITAYFHHTCLEALDQNKM